MKVGILGGGQLARMLALAGHPLDIACLVVDPSPDACAGSVSEHIVTGYDDVDALARLADETSVITYEFENVALSSVERLAARVPVHPGWRALATARDRVLEKGMFDALGIPTATYLPVSSRADLSAAIEKCGLPSILKTRTEGYDGKGQASVTSVDDALPAWRSLGERPAILESRVSFERELSVIAVRGRDGNVRVYPLAENTHMDGILRLSVARPEDPMHGAARGYVERLMHALDYVGVVALELFVDGDQLLANEFAPRVHNSGHWTIEGAVTSQFENHLRAVTGLPLGSTEALGPAAMLNLIGAVPERRDVLRVPSAHLHLYGKTPRPGRKVGHITVRADDQGTLRARVDALSGLAGVWPGIGL